MDSCSQKIESMAFLVTPTGPNHVKTTIKIPDPRISRGSKKRFKDVGRKTPLVSLPTY